MRELIASNHKRIEIVKRLQKTSECRGELFLSRKTL